MERADVAATLERLAWLSTVLDRRYMRPDQAREIFGVIAATDPPVQRVLEVGTYCGTGAILLAAMIAPIGGHVTTVDLPWTGTPNKHFAKTVDDWVRELHVENLTVVRRDDGAEGWLHDYLTAGNPPLDLAYVDGGHLWPHTCAQFAAVWAALRVGGWAVFDDVDMDAWPDVRDVWRHVVSRIVPARDRRQVGQLGFARKTRE